MLFNAKKTSESLRFFCLDAKVRLLDRCNAAMVVATGIAMCHRDIRSANPIAATSNTCVAQAAEIGLYSLKGKVHERRWVDTAAAAVAFASTVYCEAQVALTFCCLSCVNLPVQST
jgi:hypothetical protein